MKTWRAFAAVTAALVIGSADAEAQAFGIQGNWGSDTDFGLGARLELGLPNLITSDGPLSNTFLIGSFDWFFPDFCDNVDDCSYWELNGNLAVPITSSTIDPYAGLGLNVGRVAVGDASNTEVGLNLLGGLRFRLGSLGAFGEGRAVLGGVEQLVLTFGVLVGGTR
jgi:hypothetical protein